MLAIYRYIIRLSNSSSGIGYGAPILCDGSPILDNGKGEGFGIKLNDDGSYSLLCNGKNGDEFVIYTTFSEAFNGGLNWYRRWR